MMKRISLTIVTVVLLSVAVAGCSSVPGYVSVDLSKDLSPQDLARYEKEWEAAQASGGGMVLEDSNGWPLGVLAYWDRGTVMRTHGEPAEYHVRSTTGYGPLSLLYVTETHSTYDAAGKLMSTMTMGSILMHHVAMFHTSETLLPDGHWQQVSSSHWFMLVNFHSMDGHTATSLLTAPNILGVESHGHH